MDEELKAIARALVWWKPPEEVDLMYLVRRVMEMGTPKMVDCVRNKLGQQIFRDALAQAEAGNFSAASWNYWHVILGVRPTPPLPQRPAPPSPYVSTQIRRVAAGAVKSLADPGTGS
jgi:hypothetical protein